MEEKERYELIGYCSYRDTETGVISDNFVGLLNEQDQKIKDLETKLAEKDELLKQKIGDMKSTDFIKMCIKSGYVVEAKENDNQTAIVELEKVKNFLLEKIEEKQSCFDSGNYNDFADGVKTICELMLISIDKQIKELGGVENVF